VSGDVQWLVNRRPHWNTIRPIGIAEGRREIKGEAQTGRRYFISSLPAEAEQFAKAVRAHWGIENPLHYVLDAAFGEDGCRIRKDKGPENMTILRKMALTVARSDTETKGSIIGRRKRTAWSNEYLNACSSTPALPPLPLNLYALALSQAVCNGQQRGKPPTGNNLKKLRGGGTPPSLQPCGLSLPPMRGWTLRRLASECPRNAPSKQPRPQGVDRSMWPAAAPAIPLISTPVRRL
jgi:predicted transposase YbfD/YdcC